MLLLIWIALLGCDYTVPLLSTPTADIDGSALGLWQRTKDDGSTEELLVLPLSRKEYLVSYPAGNATSMFAKACLWHSGTMTLVQLNWFGTAKAESPKDKRTYQFAAYTVAGDEIRIRLLNTKVVNKDIGSSEALLKAIEENKSNPSLFRQKMLFKKVTTGNR